MNEAELLVSAPENDGVEQVFGIPGVALYEILRFAICRTQDCTKLGLPHSM
jgi:hypothetical protein